MEQFNQNGAGDLSKITAMCHSCGRIKSNAERTWFLYTNFGIGLSKGLQTCQRNWEELSFLKQTQKLLNIFNSQGWLWFALGEM